MYRKYIQFIKDEAGGEKDATVLLIVLSFIMMLAVTITVAMSIWAVVLIVSSGIKNTLIMLGGLSLLIIPVKVYHDAIKPEE
jgi:hypothetical protein